MRTKHSYFFHNLSSVATCSVQYPVCGKLRGYAPPKLIFFAKDIAWCMRFFAIITLPAFRPEDTGAW
ncbi:MAG TPA: hypothetical protein DEF41_05575 [Desulfovibrio sp.]|uniref:Uncharacterized protein n=1 Tax=Nitratidesulfovibrio vulgaris (strain ATCC 29579 / DSM 644 / CCUG 34227 / NCIMB 8303 / VKM B-1760 / Hildenborough) TaxID=882 RepID=Q728F0_NITV2|nr:hypothetical protein DVU_2653 [Nitratidesulfovibrio vulgaris str. Hildenborough]HBW15598.1 hypothetical protein [Desulfovibrio sp.]